MLRNVFVLFALSIGASLFSQYRISGKINSEENLELIGATILIENSDIGVVSDAKGNFSIENVPSGDLQLIVSYLGYETLSKRINLQSDVNLDFTLKLNSVLGDEVIVVATRAGKGTPIAYTNVTKEELNKRNLGQDLPYLLALTPSVVVSSDAGAGVGYSSIRVRGTDANRINVTLNGIPMNDAESHGVWWVNMPDFSSSLENVQIQRGVGTSTNGAGAFGASINMQSNTLKKDAYAEISSSAGSFNTFKNTVKVGTGLINEHFAFDLRLSNINSDGFIDRSSTDLKSYFVSGGYYGKNTIVKANIFSGKEETYQAWWGVPKVRLENDLEGMQRYEDHWLYSAEETQHMINSDSRTYNYYTYENEVDSYQQDHYQLFFTQKINEYLHLSTAIHYTYGRGFYEQYRVEDDFEDYGLPNVTTSTDTIYSTDMVRQKWLDNDFYGTTFSLNYKRASVDAVIGGAWNKYDGRHFGKIIWAQYLGETSKDYEWYRNTGVKTDYNVYGKINYGLMDVVNLFADVQYRHITHDINGVDDDLRDITQTHEFNFLNPKVGIHVKPSDNQEAYLSFAIAHREPNRSNFTDADPEGEAPTFETLYDIEAGYTYKHHRFSLGLNMYNMRYKDQLVLTGEINDVGSAIMVNVDKSYRRGIEIYGGVAITQKLRWDANATFSRNKILGFTEYVDNWDTWGQDEFFFEETDIAFSPDFLFTSNLAYSPIKNVNLALITQYISEQFIDNTSSEDRMLDSYLLNNVKVDYSLYFNKGVKEIEFTLLINNILNEEYESNAWVYPYLLGDERYAMDGYFPQAGINFLAGVTLKF